MGDQGLGMLPHQSQVEAAQQIITSVTSTATKYCSYRRIEKGGMQIFKPGLRGSGEVVVSLAQRMPPHPGKKSESGERFDPFGQPVWLGMLAGEITDTFAPRRTAGILSLGASSFTMPLRSR